MTESALKLAACKVCGFEFVPGPPILLETPAARIARLMDDYLAHARQYHPEIYVEIAKASQAFVTAVLMGCFKLTDEDLIKSRSQIREFCSKLLKEGPPVGQNKNVH